MTAAERHHESDARAPRAVLIGEGPQPVQFAHLLQRGGFTVIATSSPDAPLREWSAAAGVPAIAGLDALTTALTGQSFDYLFSIVNYRMIPAALLRLPTGLAINYHDGPLPRYAGVYVTSWAILNQEAEHGITWHVMEERADAGDILRQVMIPLAADETAGSLNTRCFLAAGRSFQLLLKELRAGTVTRTPQSLGERTYFGRTRALPEIDATWTAERIDAYRRALDFGGAANPLGERIPASVRAALSLRAGE